MIVSFQALGISRLINALSFVRRHFEHSHRYAPVHRKCYVNHLACLMTQQGAPNR